MSSIKKHHLPFSKTSPIQLFLLEAQKLWAFQFGMKQISNYQNRPTHSPPLPQYKKITNWFEVPVPTPFDQFKNTTYLCCNDQNSFHSKRDCINCFILFTSAYKDYFFSICKRFQSKAVPWDTKFGQFLLPLG